VAWYRSGDATNHLVARVEINHKLIIEIVDVCLAEMNREQLWGTI
jgi:hypothetical protein